MVVNFNYIILTYRQDFHYRKLYYAGEIYKISEIIIFFYHNFFKTMKKTLFCKRIWRYNRLDTQCEN